MKHFTKPLPVLFAVAVLYVFSFFAGARWPSLPYGGDSWGYYAHLPSILIHGDAGSYDKTIAAVAVHDPHFVDPRIDLYGVRPTPAGKLAIKYPLGVAILETPFFAIAHCWSKWSGGKYPADGFSRPYMLLVGLGAVFYALLGLFFLWRLLARYFPPAAVPVLVLLLAFATNLYYFSVYNNIMSHAFLFFWHAALLCATASFWERPGLARAAAVGALAGGIAITRTQEIIAAVIPLLWGLSGWPSVRERWAFFRHNPQFPAAAAAGFLAVMAPQTYYWKFVSGRWVYFSYQGETFDFRHPHIWSGLTDFHNGWLIYTPVMVFALLGLFRLRRAVPAAWWPFWGFFPLHVFITYSWWCWMYINGFGSRPMVEAYALLALPLGAFWMWGAGHYAKKALNWIIFLFFCWLNVFQTWQLKEGVLWSQDANKAYYKAIFGTFHPGRDALIAWDSGEQQPRGALARVRALVQEGYDDSTGVANVREPVHSGTFALRPDEEFSGGGEVATDSLDIRPGDWIRTGVYGYVRGSDKIWNRDQLAWLSLEFRNAEGKSIKTRGIRITSKIGNPKHSIWDTGDTDRWGEAAFFVKVPRNYQPGGKIMAYIWNPQRQKLLVDDLTLELWRKSSEN